MQVWSSAPPALPIGRAPLVGLRRQGRAARYRFQRKNCREICGLAFHEDAEAAPVQRIAAEQPVASKLPEIASSADRLLLQGRKLIRRIGRLRLFAEIFDPKIDLAHIKPRCLEIEAEIEDG